jgi:hypothetical protein
LHIKTLRASFIKQLHRQLNHIAGILKIITPRAASRRAVAFLGTVG